MSETQKQNPQIAALSQMVLEGMQREVALRAQLIVTQEALEREIASRPVATDNVEAIHAGSRSMRASKTNGVDPTAA
jgi:hypothetical protein